MKSKSALRHFLALAGSSLLAVSYTHAATVNWDGDTSNLWATAGNWDTAPANSLLTDIVNFNLATYGGNPVWAPTVGTATSINGITIGAGNGAMTLTNTAALSIGNSGINIANGAGAFTISGSTTLGASQNWTNNSANLFTFGAVTAGANTLTIGGSGNTTASGIISGTNGALTKEGAGLLTLGAANGYTGATTVNGGELRWGIANAIAAGALNINNGGTVNMQTFTDTVGAVTIAKGGTISGTTGVLTVSSITSNNGGTINTGSGSIVISGSSTLTYNDTIAGSTTFSINRLDIRGATTFNIARGDDVSGVDFDITGEIFSNSNGRNITKSGSGVMRLSGSIASGTSGHLANGTLSIQDGTMIFGKSAEVTAFAGTGLFTIGDGTGLANSAVLRYETSSNQLPNNAITINSDGRFDLNGLSETTSGALTMNGGSITTGAGTLSLGAATNTINGASTVTGNLTLSGAAATNLTLGGTASINGTTTFSGGNGAGITATGNTSIAGTLAFGSSTRTIAVTNASDVLTITANITGSGALTKNGAGTLQIGDGTTAGSMSSTSALTMGGGTLAILAPTTGSSSQTIASLATTASTGSIIRLTPGSSGNTTLTITSATPSTGAGSSLNFDYTAGTTVGGTVGNNYVVWNPALTAGIIGGAYSVTDSGGTGFATKNGTNIVRLTDPGGVGLPVSVGSAAGSYFIGSGYSTVDTATPGSLVQALSGAVEASNVTVDTTGLASGANLALGTNVLTLGAGMAFNGPNPYEITGGGAGGIRATSGSILYLNNGNTSTVTINAPILANGASGLTLNGTGSTILGGVNTYTGATMLRAGSLTIGTAGVLGSGGGTAITVNGGTLTNNSTVAITGGITGTSSLTVASGAKAILANANNFSGTTNVTGTLQLGNAGSMGTSTMTLNSGATLELRNDADTTFTAPIATAPTTGITYNFDVNQATGAGANKKLSLGNITFATSSSGSITNTINVTGGNGYILGLGTISAPSGGGGPHPVVINATTAAVEIAQFSAGSFGHVLQLQGGNSITLGNYEMGSSGNNSLTVSGSGTVVTLGTTTQTNNRAGGSAAYTLNSGTLNLTTTTSLANVRAVSGALGRPTFTINGGTLNNTSGSALTLAASPDPGTVSGSPAITIGGDFAFGTALSTSANNLNLGNGAITNTGNRTITFNGTGTTLTMGGVMTNTSGANQTTTVNGAGNTLSLGGYTLGNGFTNVINGTGNVTITGAITHSGGTSGLTYSGSGTLTIGGGVNTFTGATTIDSGTLAISSTGMLYNGSTSALTTVNSGATLELYSWAYGANGGIGTPYFGTTTLAVNGGTIRYTGIGEDTGNNQGRVFAIGTGGATLEAAGSGTWLIKRNLTAPLDQTTINGLTLAGSGNGIHSNNLVGAAGTVTKSGTGTWTLSGTNTYTGATTVTGGTLSVGTIGNGGAAGNLGQAGSAATNIVFDGGTLQYTGANATSDRAFTINAGKTATIQTTNNISFAGATGTATNGALTKTGAGTLTLTGTNTYTGVTTISQGTLALGASGSIASSTTVIVGASTTFDVSAVTGGYNLGGTQTLSGTGTVTGAMTVSGTLSPGNSPGILSTGSQTWVNGGDYNFQMLDATGAAGSGFDQIQVTGTLNLNSLTTGGFAINLWSLSSTGPDMNGPAQNFNNTIDQMWTILTTTGGITDFNAADFVVSVGANNGTNGFLNPVGGGSFSIAQNGSNLDLIYTAVVPEPGAALLGGLGMLVLLRRRRTKIG